MKLNYKLKIVFNPIQSNRKMLLFFWKLDQSQYFIDKQYKNIAQLGSVFLR
jgi:hypothetical protein